MNEARRAVAAPLSSYPSVQLERPDEPSITISGKAVDELSASPLKAPLISFVVINWNYGRYVGQTIDSIRAQDYPNFECLVIDNGSIDDSREVISRHVSGDSRFMVEHLPDNLGQLGAALWSLNRIRGSFVTFVDSDDVLFSNFASTHLQVHVALSESIAITSSNLVAVGPDGTIISGGYPAIGRNANTERAARGIRDPRTVLRLTAISDDTYAALSEHVWVLPKDTTGWLWAPGTSNMMRRSFLSMAMLSNDDGKFMRAADNHFNVFCHAMGGTTLIDVPLSAYRVHDRNYYTDREPVSGLRHGKRDLGAREQAQSRQTLQLLLDRVEYFSWLLGDQYWRTVDRLTRVPENRQRAFFRHPDCEAAFTRQAEKLRSVFGARQIIKRIRDRFSFGTARRIFKRGLNGGMSFSFARHFYTMELQRFVRRVFLRSRKSLPESSAQS